MTCRPVTRSFAFQVCEISREQPVAFLAGDVFHMSRRRSLSG
jgi:hypothetical protein